MFCQFVSIINAYECIEGIKNLYPCEIKLGKNRSYDCKKWFSPMIKK
jgi:hypothetical protein